MHEDDAARPRAPLRHQLDRRTVLRGMGGIAGSAAARTLPSVAHATPAPGAPLWEHAAARGVLYGGQVNVEFFADAPYAEHLAAECLGLTGGTVHTVAQIRGGPGAGFTFDRADRFMAFAQANRMLPTNLSHLEWYNFLPAAFAASITQANAAAKLTEHIVTVMGRYRGQVHSWNVVNEVINLGDGRPDGLRSLYPPQRNPTMPNSMLLRGTPWLQFLGPEYIDLAFHTARDADPSALLVFNQNGIEFTNAPPAPRITDVVANQEERREAVLKLLRGLKDRGAPVDVLGIQGHLSTRAMHEIFDANRFRAFLRDVAGLGLKIMVTELDINDRDEPADLATRDAAVASGYTEFLATLLDEPAVISVVTFGLTDKYSWLQRRSVAEGSATPRADGLPLRPLPLDDALNRKSAWEAIARAFATAPARPLVSPLPLPRPLPA